MPRNFLDDIRYTASLMLRFTLFQPIYEEVYENATQRRIALTALLAGLATLVLRLLLSFSLNAYIATIMQRPIDYAITPTLIHLNPSYLMSIAITMLSVTIAAVLIGKL